MSKSTISESELRRLFAAGQTIRQIAAMLGRAPSNVYATCAVLGISDSKRAAGRARDLAQLVERLAQGDTLSDIAAEQGVSRQALHQALKRARLPTACLGAVRYIRAKQRAE